MENKQSAVKGIIVVIVTLAIMLVIYLISAAIENGMSSNENTTMNAQIKEQVLIEKIKTSEVHEINKSLINVPLEVPYTIYPDNATNKSVSIVSSDNSIVKVNDDNTITALTTGEVTLTFVADDGSNVTSTSKIVIK